MGFFVRAAVGVSRFLRTGGLEMLVRWTSPRPDLRRALNPIRLSVRVLIAARRNSSTFTSFTSNVTRQKRKALITSSLVSIRTTWRSFSVAELATRLETSDATVIPTAQALGCAGLPDLRRQLIEQLRARMSPAVRLATSLENIGESPDAFLDFACATQIELLEQTRRSLRLQSFERAVDMPIGAQRVLDFGTGLAGHLAAMFAVRLQRLGTKLNPSARAARASPTRCLPCATATRSCMGQRDSRLAPDKATRRRVSIVLQTDTLSGVFGRQLSVALVAPSGDGNSFKAWPPLVCCWMCCPSPSPLASRPARCGRLKTLARCVRRSPDTNRLGTPRSRTSDPAAGQRVPHSCRKQHYGADEVWACPGFDGDSVPLRGWSPNGNLEQPFPASVPAGDA
jgi:hypothetical protein